MRRSETEGTREGNGAGKKWNPARTHACSDGREAKKEKKNQESRHAFSRAHLRSALGRQLRRQNGAAFLALHFSLSNLGRSELLRARLYSACLLATGNC